MYQLFSYDEPATTITGLDDYHTTETYRPLTAWCQTSSFGQYHIILLDDRGTRVCVCEQRERSRYMKKDEKKLNEPTTSSSQVQCRKQNITTQLIIRLSQGRRTTLWRSWINATIICNVTVSVVHFIAISAINFAMTELLGAEPDHSWKQSQGRHHMTWLVYTHTHKDATTTPSALWSRSGKEVSYATTMMMMMMMMTNYFWEHRKPISSPLNILKNC